MQAGLQIFLVFSASALCAGCGCETNRIISSASLVSGSEAFTYEGSIAESNWREGFVVYDAAIDDISCAPGGRIHVDMSGGGKRAPLLGFNLTTPWEEGDRVHFDPQLGFQDQDFYIAIWQSSREEPDLFIREATAVISSDSPLVLGLDLHVAESANPNGPSRPFAGNVTFERVGNSYGCD